MTIIDSAYFKEYRQRLGFTQAGTKTFFAAKDIHPTVDYNYIELLNTRLVDIVNKINGIVSDKIRLNGHFRLLKLRKSIDKN